MSTTTLVLLCLILLLVPIAQGKTQSLADSSLTDQAKALRVFLDCHSCDDDYIRTEITYVNYVRDRTQADVHVLVTRLRTGGGGRQYTLAFLGEKGFAGLNDTLTYTSSQTDTDDDERRGLVTVLKNGLFRYVLRTPQGRNLTTSYADAPIAQGIEDPWDYWVFRINTNTFFDGERSSKSLHLGFGARASRITESWKLRLDLDADYNEDKYEYEDNGTLYRETFIRRTREMDLSAVGSLDHHWSFGASAYLQSSTYRNFDLSVRLYPAIEFNVFPYSESTRRQLRAQYRVGVSINRYVDTTIYNKIRETVPIHQLIIAFELTEPWGSADISVTGSQYLHDLSKNNVRVRGNIDIRIYEGLSVYVSGSYSQIRDQIALPSGGATPSELLTRQREIATNYSYHGSVGLRYSFGSIYNNIVNTRMGN